MVVYARYRAVYMLHLYTAMKVQVYLEILLTTIRTCLICVYIVYLSKHGN